MNFLLFLMIIVGYFVYLTYKAYLLDIAIASLMAVSFAAITFYFSKRIENKYIVASMVTLIFISLILGPIIYFIFVISSYILSFDFNQINLLVEKLKAVVDYFPSIIQDNIKDYLNEDNVKNIYNSIIPIIGSITAKSAFFIKDIFLIIIFFFFAVLYGKDILMFLKRVIPLEDKMLEKLFFSTSEVMSVVFYSTIITAILEGILFGSLLFFYGFDFLFFTIMYAFASLIPVIGGFLMWGPISLYLYSDGRVYEAISLIVYSIIVISIIADTFIKPIIISYIKKLFKATTTLNSLLIFFSIVAGLSSFGIWGIIIGPAVTAMFISILHFYEKV